MKKDAKIIELNEYCDSLSDVKAHLDEAFEDINITEVKILINMKDISPTKLKKITDYIENHDRIVLIEHI